MRKQELIELILDYLSGGDAPSDIKGAYHPQIISNHLNIAFDKVVFDTYMEAKGYSDYSTLDSWAKNYQILITNVDGYTGDALLPFSPMQLPDNMGILQVVPTVLDVPDLTNAFAYRETNANSVFAALEVEAISQRPIFYLEMNAGSEINSHILKMDRIPQGADGVLVKMIVPFSQLDDYDQIPVPAGKVNMMRDSVIELLRQKPPEDKSNDGINQR